MKPLFNEKILLQHIAVLGKTGAGKTNTSKLLVEEVYKKGARVCVLDPIKSDWWGITSNADGSAPGLPFTILGGPRGHVPLHSNAGKVIGELVGSGALQHSILDMADFEPGGLQTFFTDFASSLFRKMRGVLYLVIEEAHEFAPKERSGFGNENMAIHWAKKLAVAGRSKGIRIILATQRVQSLHNALLGSCDTMLAHRFITPADKEPIVKWLKSNLTPEKEKEVSSSIPSLQTGEAWVCSGEAGIFERHRFPLISTYDNSATPTEHSDFAKVKTFQVNHETLEKIIGDAANAVKSDDPKVLRAEVSRLNAEVAKLQAQKPEKAETVTVKVPFFTEEEGFAVQKLEMTARDLAAKADLLWDAARALEKSVNQRLSDQKAAKAPVAAPKIVVDQHKGVRVVKPANSSLGNSGIKRMLTAIAQTPGIKHRELGLRSQLSSSSGSFSTYLSRLRTNAWITESNGFHITEDGLNVLGDYEPLPTGSNLRAHWLNELGNGGARRILEVLMEAYPNSLSQEAISNMAGLSHSSGSFSTYLSKLRTLNLIEGRNPITASAELFA